MPRPLGVFGGQSFWLLNRLRRWQWRKYDYHHGLVSFFTDARLFGQDEQDLPDGRVPWSGARELAWSSRWGDARIPGRTSFQESVVGNLRPWIEPPKITPEAIRGRAEVISGSACPRFVLLCEGTVRPLRRCAVSEERAGVITIRNPVSSALVARFGPTQTGWPANFDHNCFS